MTKFITLFAFSTICLSLNAQNNQSNISPSKESTDISYSLPIKVIESKNSLSNTATANFKFKAKKGSINIYKGSNELAIKEKIERYQKLACCQEEIQLLKEKLNTTID